MSLSGIVCPRYLPRKACLRESKLLHTQWVPTLPRPRGRTEPGARSPEQGRLLVSSQVMQVVREQITRALPSKPNSLDQFKSKLRSLSYSEILRLRQSERMSQDDFQSPPIV